MRLRISDFYFMVRSASIRARYYLGGALCKIILIVSCGRYLNRYSVTFTGADSVMECPFYGSKKELYREKSTGFVKRKEGAKNEKMYI